MGGGVGGKITKSVDVVCICVVFSALLLPDKAGGCLDYWLCNVLEQLVAVEPDNDLGKFPHVRIEHTRVQVHLLAVGSNQQYFVTKLL